MEITAQMMDALRESITVDDAIAASGAIGKELDLFRDKMAEIGVDRIEMDRDLAQELVLKHAKRADMEELALKVLNELDLHIGDMVEYNQEDTPVSAIGEIVEFTSDYRAMIRNEHGTSREVPVVRILQKIKKEAVYMRPGPPSGTYAPLAEEAIEGTGKIGQEDEDQDDRPIWEIAEEIGAQIPEEEWNKLPSDLSTNIDYYLYGLPKKDDEKDEDEQEKEGAGRSWDLLRTLIEAESLQMPFLTPKQVEFNVKMKQVTGQLPTIHNIGDIIRFLHNGETYTGVIQEFEEAESEQSYIVRLFNKPEAYQVGYENVIELIEPIGDPVVPDTSYHQPWIELMRRGEIPHDEMANYLGVPVHEIDKFIDMEIENVSTSMKEAMQTFAQNTETEPYRVPVVERTREQDRFEIYDMNDVILEDQQADPANWDSQMGWDQTMSETEQEELPLIRPG